MKMKPAIKKIWIKGLRSGEYEQGQGLLCYENKWCCLGVLADVALEADWVSTDNDVWVLDDGNGQREASGFNIAQLVKLGLTAAQQNILVRMNDTYGYSFDDIADYLEMNKEI